MRLVPCLGLITLLAGSAGAQPAPLEAAARQLIAELAAGNAAAVVKRFDANMKRALPAAQLTATWKGIITQAGPFQSAGRAMVKKMSGHDVLVIRCNFAAAALDARVVFDSAGKVAGLFFSPPGPAALPWKAPAYARGAFDEKQVKAGTTAFPLDGKLCLPRGEGPFPAVVLVHGSGPNDMDETVGPNKPFKDLAWGLAASGVAVLRYDKRTRRYPDRVAPGFTVKDEVIDDALAAVELLLRTPRIDSKRIVVVGHSLGGWLAPRIALAEKRIAGIVIMAGPTREFGELLLEQLRLVAPDQVAAAETAARQIRDPGLKPDAVVTVLGVKTHGAYWIDYRAHPPQTMVRKLRIPMLILQGGRDYQVTAADLEGWRRALKGRRQVSFKLYPALNHLFIEGTGVSRPAEYLRAGHVDGEVVKDIGAWVRAR